LAENRRVDVLICALPQELLEITLTDFRPEDAEEDTKTPNAKLTQIIDFHDLLKAKTLHLNTPIQIITPPTYGKKIRRKKKRSSNSIKKLQDEATQAWNFHTALYYKAQGIPWRLLRDPTQFTTCYVGVSFYKSLDNSALNTSVAQIFNERGEGVIVRGGPARISKDDRQPHLQREDANELLFNVVSRYREEHKSFPARIVIHKSSTYDHAEKRGFQEAAQNLHVELLDLISISRSSIRLFRTGAFPPLRGTFLSLDEETHILYTRGSVDFFSTYPGIYVPRPLLFRCEYTEQTPRFLAQEILSLTKMNWNTTQFDGSEPMTLHTSEQVRAVLKYIDIDEKNIASSYRFYM
jgi:argonaute-like protein implicated in RNA metabolism and viral defense